MINAPRNEASVGGLSASNCNGKQRDETGSIFEQTESRNDVPRAVTCRGNGAASEGPAGGDDGAGGGGKGVGGGRGGERGVFKFKFRFKIFCSMSCNGL